MRTSLEELVLERVKYVTDSGFAVVIDPVLPSIDIKNEEGTHFSFQEHAAVDYIEQARKMYDHNGSLTFEHCLVANAKDYVDSL